MAFLYIAAGLNHFRRPEFYLRLMPDYLPAPQLLNQISGIAEIILGVLLMINPTRTLAAWGIALMLVLFMTVHIYMLQQSYSQPGYFMSPAMGWFRIGLQFGLIGWALWYRKPV
jgi:uncharacterized membrane protein